MRPSVVVDSRRLLRAVAIGFLVFLFVGGGVGFAVAASENADDERTLTVPAPRPGDRAVYSVRQSIVDPTLAKGDLDYFSEATYEWLPERWDVDGQFQTRLVHPLRSTFLWAEGTQYEHRYIRESAYDAATGAVISETQVWEGETAPDSEFVDRVYIGATTEERQRQTRYDGFQGQLGPCGFSLPFHGRAYDGRPFWIQGNCDWPGGLDGFTYEAGGWRETPRGKVYRFLAVEDTRFALDYDESSPFPAWATAVLSETITREYTMGRYFVLTRTSSQEGAGSYTPLPEPAIQPSEPVRLVARTPWGLDDSDVAHRFPLSQAYSAVLAESKPPTDNDPTLAQWMAAHPDGYLAHASTTEYHDRTGQPITWWYLVWTDGSGRLGKQVYNGPVGSGTVLLPKETGQTTTVYDWDGAGFPYPDYGLVPPERVPASLPKVSDLLAQYARMTGDAAASSYGFGILCKSPGCAEAWVGVTAGRNERDYDDAVLGPVDRTVQPYATNYDALQADENGHLRLKWREVQSQEAAFPLVPVPQPAQPQEQAAPVPVAGAWMFPGTPTATTGISLLAILAGLLYYFWPAVKGAPLLGLFSRIRDDKVLDHPQRARLMETIRADPGVHFQELSRRLGLGHGALDHHVRKLVDAGLVVVRKSPGYTCFFPKATDRHVMDAAPTLRSGGSRAVLHAVAAKPGTSSRDLAVHLGLAPSTVSYHLKRLETAGLVLPDPKAGVRLTPLGEQAKATA